MHPKRVSNRMESPQQGFSLVELLVVCVLLVGLSAGLYSFYAGKSKPGPNGEKTARTPMERAHDPECASQLSQLRQALQMAQTDSENGKYPAQLTDIHGVPQTFFQCPSGHQPYQYDPETGQVHCTTFGHEKY
jgi:prepilin-type N-terminal cleavage/methylation domain-containing protein